MIKEFYDALNDANKKQFVKRVLETTDWALPTFYYKLRHNNYSKLEQEAINKIIESWQAVES